MYTSLIEYKCCQTFVFLAELVGNFSFLVPLLPYPAICITEIWSFYSITPMHIMLWFMFCAQMLAVSIIVLNQVIVPIYMGNTMMSSLNTLYFAHREAILDFISKKKKKIINVESLAASSTANSQSRNLSQQNRALANSSRNSAVN
ncbi:unnamed protein product, partial [Mesorhabditis belari]|uniref:Uncharacterized protein n=1 Tax=Mesorhabditis belari TaxID=2138241 RepID=A0AAF3FAY3_9BILA